MWKGSKQNTISILQNNSCGTLLHTRAVQGHTGGDVIALELMGYVAIPLRWKEFLFRRGCSFDVMSILEAGLSTRAR